jgi:hypothetical protein
MIDPVIATTAMTIATIFLKKALEKSGEKFGEAMSTKVGQAIDRIRQHSPEVAIALEAFDEDESGGFGNDSRRSDFCGVVG